MAAALLLGCTAGICVAQPWGEPPGSTPAEAEIFPDPAQAHPPEGIPLTPSQAALIQPGLTKDQVRALLGPPHFNEGIFEVVQWSYLVFPVGTADLGAACQLNLHFFKERFNDPYRISRIAWNSPNCLPQAS
ncbi:outer membrane protein assembly factor BamE [Xylophilus rhododendri]|uniref:Outer membrane protein assembly factor BamE n=2 Tax=Xylophilus rhododendri TaxID=2697032 RepID=A0A857JE61_9BURK|nr:outer membrane protein assembly factor BamE [Xylophilus rhododendri]